MKIEEFAKSTPPPRFVGRKGFVCAICALLCIVFAFALVGCGSGYTDEDDYANFVKWQARYETEKELVGLLREYDAAYTAYSSGVGGGSSIVFSVRGVTVLTDANVAAAWVAYDSINGYCVCIELDNSGAATLADITTSNVGEILEVAEVNDGNRTVLFSAAIHGTVSNGKMLLNQTTEAAAKELCCKFGTGAIKIAAAAYNAKRAAVSAREVNSGYLPAELPESPEYLDVSVYLQKAEAMGF